MKKQQQSITYIYTYIYTLMYVYIHITVTYRYIHGDVLTNAYDTFDLGAETPLHQDPFKAQTQSPSRGMAAPSRQMQMLLCPHVRGMLRGIPGGQTLKLWSGYTSAPLVGALFRYLLALCRFEVPCSGCWSFVRAWSGRLFSGLRCPAAFR